MVLVLLVAADLVKGAVLVEALDLARAQDLDRGLVLVEALDQDWD
jgi:hypothetical protein